MRLAAGARVRLWLSDFCTNSSYRSPLRLLLPGVLEYHPNRPFLLLW